MREITADQFEKNAAALLDAAQHERLLITRKGKPLAVMVGIQNKDEEDLAWESDVAFWRLIRARRKEKETQSLDQVKEMLGLNGTRQTAEKPAKARKRSR